MKIQLKLFVGLLFTIGLLSSCNESKPNGYWSDTAQEGTIRIACDECFQPVIDELIPVFENCYKKDVEVIPIYTDEVHAMELLKKDSVRLVITSRGFTEAESHFFDKERNTVARQYRFASDGLALVVNNSNPDTMITVVDVRRILSGEVKKWSDIYPKSKLGDILLVFDNTNSSTVRFAVDSVCLGKQIANDNVMATKTNAEVIDFVKKTPNAIGVVGSTWLRNRDDSLNVSFDQSVRVMAVSNQSVARVADSWKPYQAYLWTRDYPLIRPVYALVCDPARALSWGFSQFLLGQKAQIVIGQTSSLLPENVSINIRNMHVSD